MFRQMINLNVLNGDVYHKNECAGRLWKGIKNKYNDNV